MNLIHLKPNQYHAMITNSQIRGFVDLEFVKACEEHDTDKPDAGNFVRLHTNDGLIRHQNLKGTCYNWHLGGPM